MESLESKFGFLQEISNFLIQENKGEKNAKSKTNKI